MKNFFKSSASIGLTVAISSIVVAGIVYAGNLTAPSGTATSTAYTLSDIYARLTKNVATTTTGNHSLSTTTSPASSFYTLTQIYNAIPNIDATKVLTGTTYLGIAGSASAGYAYPSAPLKTGVTFCNTYSNNYDYGNYDNAVQSPCSGSGQDGETQQGVARSYTDNGNGTVSDNSTGLMWQKCGDGQTGSDCSGGSAVHLAYDDGNGNLGSADLPAINYCKTLSLGGHADWRLPSVNELETLVDFGQQNPAINTTYFPNTQSGSYWSSAAYQGNAGYAWIVYFTTAESALTVWMVRSYVRCVR